MNTSTYPRISTDTDVLAFVEDGLELYVNERCIFLLKGETLYMAFQFASNRDDRIWQFSVWNDSPDEPIELYDESLENLIPVSLEEIGLIVATCIDGYYRKHRESLYNKRVKERLQALASDDHHLVLREMFHQIDHLDTDGSIWRDVNRYAPIRVMDNPAYAHTLLFGSKTEKKRLMRKLFSPVTYEVLKIHKRGRRYIDALAANLLRCYHVD